jgi:membrane dipeptidase
VGAKESGVSQGGNGIDDRTRQLWERAIIIDGLGVTAMNYEAQREAGITATNATLLSRLAKFPEAIQRVDEYLSLIELSEGQAILVTTAADIQRAKTEGTFGIILGFQTGSVVEDQLPYLRTLYRLGVRIIQLTYMERNLLGDGCLEPENRGLTAIGHEVVSEMNRIGMLVDLSHVGYKTALDAIQHSSKPVVFSHSNPRSMGDSPRNIPDDLMKALAEKGGVMGITPYTPFARVKQGTLPTFDDYFAHVDYAVKLIGIDHVGFGTDFIEGRDHLSFTRGMQWTYPEIVQDYGLKSRHVTGLDRLDKLPLLAQGLLQRGYSEDDVEKFLGLNFLRVFREAWG